MQTTKLFLMLTAAILGLLVSSCSEEDDEDVQKEANYDLSLEIKTDGTTSNGSVFAAIDDKNFYLDYVKYTIESGHLEVSGFDNKNLKGHVTIPATITYKGTDYKVLSICDKAFFRCSYQLTSVIIGNNVTSIGEYAFDFCYKLETVMIGNGVKTIGDGAFTECI
jgi:hypothetical protein